MQVEVLTGVVAGLELAVFLVVMVYAWLADLPYKLKGIHWLNLMAVALMVAALAELLHFLASIGPEYAVWPWIASSENLMWLLDIAYLVAGLAIILFLRHVNHHLKEYG